MWLDYGDMKNETFPVALSYLYKPVDDLLKLFNVRQIVDFFLKD